MVMMVDQVIDDDQQFGFLENHIPPLEEEALTFETGSWDATIHEETEFDLTGPVSFTLPKALS